MVNNTSVGEEKQLIEQPGFNSLTHYVYAHMTGIDRDYNEVFEDVERIWNWVSDNYAATYYPQVSVGWDESVIAKTVGKVKMIFYFRKSALAILSSPVANWPPWS